VFDSRTGQSKGFAQQIERRSTMDARVKPAHDAEWRASGPLTRPLAPRRTPYRAKGEGQSYPAAILAITAIDGGK